MFAEIISSQWMGTDEQKRFESNVSLSDEKTEELVLEEIRRRYEFGEGRRRSVEFKTSIIIGIDALLASLVSSQSFGLILVSIIISLVLISTILGIQVLRVRGYMIAGKENIDDYMGYVTSDRQESLMRRLIRSYIVSIENNKKLNDYKYGRYRWAYRCVAAAVVVVSIATIIQSGCSTTPMFNIDILSSTRNICRYL